MTYYWIISDLDNTDETTQIAKIGGIYYSRLMLGYKLYEKYVVNLADDDYIVAKLSLQSSIQRINERDLDYIKSKKYL